MRKLILILFGLLLFLSQSAAQAATIVDHTCCDLTKIPVSAINKAKSDLHIAYGHTSHGSQLTTGMSGLVAFVNGGGLGLNLPDNIFAYNHGGSSGALDLHDYAMGGDCGYYPQWVNNTRAYLNDPAHSNTNVIIWSWCGQVSGKTAQSMIHDYLAPMSQLEIDYPNVTFVYMTGHLDGTGLTGNLHLRNEQIRNYCRTNNKVLFDFEDIETYDPDNRYFGDKSVNDHCDYDTDGNGSRDGNWATQWQDSHVIGTDWYSCPSAHSMPLNANRKAYAAWWLWAKLSGWNGSSQELTKLYYPHVTNASPWNTEICIINKNTLLTIQGKFHAYTDQGVEILPSVAKNIPPNGRIGLILSHIFKTSQKIAYVIFESSSDKICGYTKFFIDNKYMAAVPAILSKDISNGNVYIPHIALNQGWWTGLGLVNTTNASVTLGFEFNNGSTITKILGPGAHSSFTMSSLLTGKDIDNIKAGAIKNATGIIGLELFGTNNHYLSGITLSDKTFTRLYYPHVASDSDWWTGIVVYNPGNNNLSITIKPYDKSGRLLSFANPEAATISLQAKTKYIGTAASLSFPQKTAWFALESSLPVTGFELFGRQDKTRLGGYGTLSQGLSSGIFPRLSSNSEGWSGIAFVNIADNSAQVTLAAYDDTGNNIGNTEFNLNAHGKIVSIAQSLFSSSIASATYIRFTSSQKLVGFLLTGSGSFLLDALPSL